MWFPRDDSDRHRFLYHKNRHLLVIALAPDVLYRSGASFSPHVFIRIKLSSAAVLGLDGYENRSSR